MITSGLGKIILPHTRTIYGYIAANTMITYAGTGFFTSITSMLIDDFGKHRAATSYGMLKVIQGVLNCAFPFLTGG